MSNISRLRSKLSELELLILNALVIRKVALTSHLASICLNIHTPNTERRIQRFCKKLESLKLIKSTTIKIAHAMGGALALRWQITRLGLKIALMDGAELSCKLRYWNENTGLATAEHTFEVNDLECSLLKEQYNNANFKVEEIKREPYCWRKWSGIDLKPDMFARVSSNDKSKNYFIELDRGTIKPGAFLEKCRLYRDYLVQTYQTEWNSTIPRVLWVTLDQPRAERFKRHLGADMGKFAGIFRVITKADFASEILGVKNG